MPFEIHDFLVAQSLSNAGHARGSDDFTS